MSGQKERKGKKPKGKGRLEKVMVYKKKLVSKIVFN
jgi:hypothetical protein